jgi:hypothetical protein
MTTPEELFEAIEKDPKKIEVIVEQNSAKITTAQNDTIIAEMIKKYNISDKQAFVALCIICQKGGTSKRALGNIYANVDGINITLENIRSILPKRISLRQWARTYATLIYKICSKYDIAGDLTKKITRKYSNISPEDCIWLSNFQMDNPDCPMEFRAHIVEHFNELFPNSNKTLGN